jgi:AcrR family transcriptional regulator
MAATETRDLILNVAEELFAERGFHGVSVREIADRAGVRQSLIHYHFSNKETLYAAVYARRAIPINAQRSASLQAVEEKNAGAPALDAAVAAFMAPSVLTSRGRTGGAAYARLITQLINDPQKHAQRISRSYNDPMALRMLEVLRKALPKADPVALTWGYLFAVGAMTTAIEQTGRARRLDPGCDPADVQRTLDLLVKFVAGGLEALAAPPTRRARSISASFPRQRESRGRKPKPKNWVPAFAGTSGK